MQPTDELRVACAHGLIWEALPLWWFADAIFLIRRTSEIDWERLLRYGHETRMILPLREALRYVARRFQAPVPDGFLQELEAIAVSSADHQPHL